MSHIYTLIALAVAFLLFTSPCPTGYESTYLHPLLFSLCYEFTPPFRRRKFSCVSLAILFVVAFIRYVICPLFLFLGDFPDAPVKDVESLHKGMTLMCYEEIAFFAVVAFMGKKIVRDTQRSKSMILNRLKLNHYYSFFLLVAVTSILLVPSILSRYHLTFGLTGYEYDLLDRTVKSSFLTLLGFIVNAARYIIVLLAIGYCYKKYKIRNDEVYVYISFCVVFINSMFIYDISRFSVLIPTVALAYLLYQLYPSKRKTIIVWCLVVGVILIAATTAVKMFSEARGGSDEASDITSWAVLLQTYFMGYREVGVGVYMAEHLRENGLLYFLNDIGSNVMMISKYSLDQLRLVHLYNNVYSGGVAMDKIPPNLCAGYTYFGTLLAPLITIFFTWLALWFDRRSQRTNQIEFKFLYVYSALMCSFVMMQFYTMIISTLVNTIFVLYVIFKMNEILFVKKVSRHHSI